MNKRIAIITLVLILLQFMLFSITSIAQDLSDLQEQKNELQNQINESNEQINEIQIDLTENLEQLNNLNSKITTYEEDISSLEENLAQIEKEINQVSQKLQSAEENYNKQREVLQNRLVAMYEAGDIYYLDVLLKSNSISEFISNYYLIGEVARYDNELLESIEEQKTQIEEIKETLTERKESLQSIKKNKEKITVALGNSKIIRNSYINKLTEEEKATQDTIDKCQAELNRLETQIVALTTGNLGSDYVGGVFAWPAPGYTTITSRFGTRVHPILKVTRTHTGTDIAMPTGSYIVAANDGVVIEATYSTTGYGNMVMIDHGGGIVTLYGHGSEILVETGQTVKKGDIIMKAGSTGWSTGPHLHFEVRINGTAVDSLPFITNQSNNEINQENGGEN